MQKFTVSTSKGFIHTTDFSSAMRILELEMEQKREAIEKEKEEHKRLQEEFIQWLDKTIPQTEEEIIKAKYEGGEGR